MFCLHSADLRGPTGTVTASTATLNPHVGDCWLLLGGSRVSVKTTNLLLSVSVVLVAATFSSQRQVHGKSGPFGFRSVEIFKVEGQTHGLAVQDLDGDGRPDLVVANNDEATIDLFYQRAAGTPIDEDKEAPVLAAALSKELRLE